jgi:hypothetical protein
MATRQQLNGTSRRTKLLADLINLCDGIAQALRDTGQPLISSSRGPTEFQRIRNQVRTLVRASLRSVRACRRNTLSPVLIRLADRLEKISGACERCEQANQEHLETFRCLAKEEAAGVAPNALRSRQ